MSAISRREFEELRREVRQLRQDVAQRAIGGGGAKVQPLMKLTVTGGNTLVSGETGIKFASVASVPSAYDPNVDTTFVDGIGRGTLRIDGVVQSGFVLIVNDGTGGINFALLANDLPVTVSTKSIAVAGDPNGATVTCYVPHFL